MPPRSAKMKRRIFGFQRRVWWPKWTPASSRSRIETAPVETGSVETAIRSSFRIRFWYRAGGSRGAPLARRGTRATAGAPGSRNRDPNRLAASRRFQRSGKIGRKRRRDVDRRSRDGMGEGEPGRVEELALEAEVSSDPVDGVAGDREIDRGEVHADLVRSPGLESDAQECMVREQLLELEVRHGCARGARIERVADPVVPVAADRRGARHATRPCLSRLEREGLARPYPAAHEALQPLVRLLRARDDEQA